MRSKQHFLLIYTCIPSRRAALCKKTFLFFYHMVVQKLQKILERVFNRHYKPIKDNILKNSQSEARQKVIKQAQLSLTYHYEYYKSHVNICSKLFLKKSTSFNLPFY